MRILIVEDDALLAFDLEDLLREAGAEPIGPALSLTDGKALAETREFDAALLDIDLGNEKVWPLAEYLVAQRRPFAFVSALCALGAMPTGLGVARCLSKPARPHAIIDLVAEMVTSDQHAHRARQLSA